MADTFQVTEDNFSKTERRFLLFQVDLGDRGLNTVLGVRGLTDTRAPQDSVRISDPVDYDDPASPIYWRKVNNFQDGENNNSYVKELKNQFEIFLAQFQNAISNRSIKLKGTEGRPYVDMSDFVKSVDGYSVRLDTMDNKMNLVLARPDSTDFAEAPENTPGEIVVNFNDDVFGTLNPNENDVVVVKAAFGPDQDFEPEFIGVITKIQKSFSYGKVDSFNLEITGLSKILYTSQMVKNKSVRPGEFLPGIELNDKARTTPYSHNFDRKNIREIFKYILDDSLSCKEIDRNTSTFLYRLDPSVFISFSQFGFQHNIFVLIALYLMSVTEAPVPAEGSLESRLFPQTLPTGLDSVVLGFNNDAKLAAQDASAAEGETIEPRSASRPVLDFFVRGVLERGDHNRGYNRMARQGVERFFSEMTKPADILGEVRSNSYTDIFESRDGVIVCRPPRFNKVEITRSESVRISAETNFKDLLQLTPQNVWEFNPNSDFVIKSEELVDIGSVSKDEMVLESRVDVKAIFPFRGDVDYPTALYVDPDILFRYGLRTHGAVTNPNAYNKKLARLFAPIALAMVNAPTRTLEIVVKDNRKYYVGKLYYLEAIDMVAYLVQDTINHRYGGFSTRSLSFTMLRQVIRRPISEIMLSSDEVLNVGMMFTTDFPNQGGMDSIVADGFEFQAADVASGPVRPTVKNLMFTKGKLFLEELARQLPPAPTQSVELHAGSKKSDQGSENGKQSAASMKLVMFKYIPGIEDLIMEVESNPQATEPPTEKTNSVSNASRVAKNERLRTMMDPLEFLYYTAGFKNGIEQNADDRLRYTQLIINISSRAIREQKPNFLAGFPPIAIDYTRDEQAPMSIAGLLNYVYPTLPTPGTIQTDSSFVEVPGDAVITYMKSPFIAQAFSTPSQNLALSQLLLNKLVNLDLDMKFITDLTTKLTMNFFGIQQYYYLDVDKFILFGSRERPSHYLETLVVGSRDNLEVSKFQTSILESVGCLKLNKDMTAFENEFFTIPIRDGAFDLPFGHLVLRLGAKPGEMAFHKVFNSAGLRDGGRFKITPGSLSNEFLIKPLDIQSKITDENNPFAGTIELDGTLSVASPSGLFFMSPFMEPTIERLMDIYLPPKYGGNLTPDEADKQKKLSSRGVLTSQAKRQNGQAINVSIDALLVSSKANIQVKGGVRPKATPLASGSVPPIYRRFEQQAVRIFTNGQILPITNALEADLILPDATNLGKRQLMIYTLFVEDFQENSYAARLQSNSVAATVGA